MICGVQRIIEANGKRNGGDDRSARGGFAGSSGPAVTASIQLSIVKTIDEFRVSPNLRNRLVAM